VRIAAFFMPFFAFLVGAVGFYIRRLELQTVFDSAGLPERGAVLTYALIALAVVFFVFSLIFSIIVAARHSALKGFENAFGTDSLAYPFSFGLIGLIWLAVTFMYFLENRAGGHLTLLTIYFSIFSALSAISASFFAVEMFNDPSRKSVFALSVIPTLFLCFWLVLVYRDNASNPILLSYGYQILAIIASALAFYFTSGFVYGKPAPGKTVFFYLMAIFFCFITIADGHNIMIRAIFGSILLMNLLYLYKLVRNLRRKKAA